MAITIKENIPLAPLTTFKIGGNALYFVKIADEKEILEAMSWANQHKLGVFIFSGGSNLLIPDDGVDGLVIQLVGDEFYIKENILYAHAGCNLLSLITETSKHNFGGWEKLAGIPGSIGGAVRGNAGAFGIEIKDIVRKVTAINRKTSEIVTFNKENCNFAYRNSFFKENPEWIITKVTISLKNIGSNDSLSIIQNTIAEREKRHLQNILAAGSFFINPIAPKEICELFAKEKGVIPRENRVPAGWLIDKAGMKGISVGDAQSSQMHTNYIINNSNATAKDVIALANKIKSAVKEKFSITLQEEACIVPSILTK